MIPHNNNPEFWAIVTGCTGGIGLSFVNELRKKNYNLILIGRKLDRISHVRDSNIHIIEFDIDFIKDSSLHLFYHNLFSTIKTRNLKIRYVINNIGMSYPFPSLFHEQENMDLYNSIISCNISVITNITYSIINALPAYLQHEVTFVNISSILCDIDSPYFTVYSATKAYISKLTSNLQLEYSDKKINFVCIKPWMVSTKMLGKITKASIFSPDPDTYVKSICDNGIYFPHELLTWFSLIFRLPILNKLFVYMYKRCVIKRR